MPRKEPTMRKFQVVKVSFNMSTLVTERKIVARGLPEGQAVAQAIAMNDKITGERDLAYAYQAVREG